jgi:hypothetical protein
MFLHSHLLWSAICYWFHFSVAGAGLVALGPPGAPETISYNVSSWTDDDPHNSDANETINDSVTAVAPQGHVRFRNTTTETEIDQQPDPGSDWWLVNQKFQNVV